MKIRKAVITAAGPAQRSIPVQVLIDHDGRQRSVLAILIQVILKAGIDEICVVTHPGDENRFREAASSEPCQFRTVTQPEPGGYAQALYCASEFAAGEPILHLVGDHMYVGGENGGSARRLVSLAESEECSVSAVQPTRESLLHLFGAVGARRITGRPGAYRVDRVIEKPTPTEAEQKLLTPGLRAGHYLCFFGMHVLTPRAMEILGTQLSLAGDPRQVTLSGALAELGHHEQYLALEDTHRRYDLGSPYGLMMAQMALALRSPHRDEILYQVLELVSDRGLSRGSGSAA
jgi:UTP--glucose-1-phosphate uridylyltransferase